VLIVDRRRLFGEALRHSLVEAGYTSVEIATCASETLEALTAGPPEVAIISSDPSEATEDGVHRAIVSGSPGCRVILLVDEGHAGVAPKIGSDVQALISKATPASQFVRAVEEFMGGEPLPRIRAPAPAGRPTGGEAAGRLTTREREVLQMLASGATSDAIAARFGVQANTARKHIQNVLTKLQVHSRLEAVAVALRKGIVKVPDVANEDGRSGPLESIPGRVTSKP
jgi:two-component system nitrate/nitrite response regulator NarL